MTMWQRKKREQMKVTMILLALPREWVVCATALEHCEVKKSTLKNARQSKGKTKEPDWMMLSKRKRIRRRWNHNGPGRERRRKRDLKAETHSHEHAPTEPRISKSTQRALPGKKQSHQMKKEGETMKVMMSGHRMRKRRRKMLSARKQMAPQQHQQEDIEISKKSKEMIMKEATSEKKRDRERKRQMRQHLGTASRRGNCCSSQSPPRPRQDPTAAACIDQLEQKEGARWDSSLTNCAKGQAENQWQLKKKKRTDGTQS